MAGFYWVTHQFDLGSFVIDNSFAVCLHPGDQVYAGGASTDNGNQNTITVQNSPDAAGGYTAWESTVLNIDSTDHVIHTWALCAPGNLSVTNEARRVPPKADITHPVARH